MRFLRVPPLPPGQTVYCAAPPPERDSVHSLDVETVRALEEMARRWKVRESEALRRAIRSAAAREGPADEDAIEALTEVRDSLDLSREKAER